MCKGECGCISITPRMTIPLPRFCTRKCVFTAWSPFIIEVLEQCSEKDLLAREVYWIGALRTDIVGFNMRHKTDLRGKSPGKRVSLCILKLITSTDTSCIRSRVAFVEFTV